MSRVTSLCAKSVFPGFDLSLRRPSRGSEVPGLLQEYQLDEAAQQIWNEIARLNQEVARGKPWEILKSGKIMELHEVLGRWIDGIHRVAIDLRPFLPETSQKMIDALNTRPIQAAKPLFPRMS